MFKYAFILVCLTPLFCNADTIKPFTSDGCSLFPDGTLVQNTLWLDCCTAHDLAYWQGGTAKMREIADQDLKHCVDKVGQKHIAKLMLAGVRVGGTPYLPTQFRWGYGWPYLRGYQENSASDKVQIEQALKAYYQKHQLKRN
ncbi:hypothetical protein [Thalassotalea sp. PLHSN55]|uniref:hypothetical protein n=1 Tax=Thalassotalea sp. PLHSN55 TaxID=3435888 RepID=UPI003F85F2FE